MKLKRQGLYLLATAALSIAIGDFSVLCAQTIPTENLHDKQVEDLFDRAGGLKIEYRAQIQLDLMESAPVPIVKKHLPDLKQLSDDLGSVQYQYPYQYATKFSFTQNAEYWIWTSLFSTKIDSLSMRIRLLNLVYKLDPQWAMREFKDIAPRPPKFDCSAVLVAKPEEYLVAAPRFVFNGGGPTTAADYEWLDDYISNASSPLLLAPIASFLAASRANNDRSTAAVHVFELLLSRSSASDREIGVIFNSQKFGDILRTLAAKLAKEQRDPARLLLAYRSFLEKSHAEGTCSDSTVDWELLRSSFNGLLVDLQQDQKIQSLQGDEFKGQAVASPASAHDTPMPDQTTTNRLLKDLYAARKPEDGFLAKLQSVGGVNSGSDQTQVATEALISASNEMNPVRDPCPECAAFFKTQMLLMGSDLLADSPQKERLLLAAVDSLAQNPNQDDSPVLWLNQVNLVLNLTRKMSPAMVKLLKQDQRNDSYIPFAPSTMAPEIKKAIAATGNNTLQLYLRDEELNPHAFSAPYLDELKK